MNHTHWASNIILVDADYADGVVFDLTVNFERMLDRHIDRADLAKWLDCLALDGGIWPGRNEIQVLFIHTTDKSRLTNFVPSDYAKELDAKAFTDNLGEFTLHSFAPEGFASHEQFFLQSLETLLEAQSVKRLLVVANLEQKAEQIINAVQQSTGKDVTLFSMTPQSGEGFKHEILGYSLMQALGISADELQ